MNNKKLIRFVESFLILPVTMSVPLGNLPNSNPLVPAPQIVLSQLNIEATGILAFNQAVDQKAQKTLENKALAIDTYFKEHDMPLEGYGMKMLQEAEKNDLEWNLLPAISVIETTGGQRMCKNPKAPNNPWGWGSCKIGFKSIDESIEIVALNLGGNNPKTAHHYDGKNTKEILEKYNPPSIVPNYVTKVTKVMDEINDIFNKIQNADTTNVVKV